MLIDALLKQSSPLPKKESQMDKLIDGVKRLLVVLALLLVMLIPFISYSQLQ